MISSASTLLLATLVFNAASVFGAPVRYPNADMAVRAEITEPVVPRVRFASSREVPEVRDTVPPPVQKREASTEDANLPRRFPRRVYHDFYQKRADPVEPPVARAPKPDSERRFPRRVYKDLHAERADTPPVARAEKPQSEPRYPRRALYEKRHDTAAPAVPTAVANSTDTTAVIKNFIDSTTNQTLQPGTTIKETTVLMNKVTYVSDKNAPAPANNQCNPAPAAGSSSIPSGTPTSVATSASSTGTTAPTSSADPAAISSSATTVPTSSADPSATPSSATSSSDAQPTPTPASATDASATTTTAADPAASTDVTNARRSIKEVTNEPVAREPEPQFKPEGMPSVQASGPISFGEEPSGPIVPREPAPAVQRTSGPLEPREPLKRTSGPLEPREPSPAPAPVQRTSGPLEPREPLKRTSGPLEPREPAPVQRTSGPLEPREPAPLERTRGPLLPRRLGFSGAALASLARRSK